MCPLLPLARYRDMFVSLVRQVLPYLSRAPARPSFAEENAENAVKWKNQEKNKIKTSGVEGQKNRVTLKQEKKRKKRKRKKIRFVLRYPTKCHTPRKAGGPLTLLGTTTPSGMERAPGGVLVIWAK